MMNPECSIEDRSMEDGGLTRMKFSEIHPDSWPDLQLYLDTCLIPVSGLTGEEEPWEAAVKAARTGEWLKPIEQAFHGRTVTLPAYHYYSGTPEDAAKLSGLCERLRSGGFRFVIAICGLPGALGGAVSADLLIQPEAEEDEPDPDALRGAITQLWRQNAARA
jgi:23S rRNA (pseudouridine1915-N3)-methyltransferase